MPIGPGFYPAIVLVFMAIMSAVLVIQDFVAQRQAPATVAGQAADLVHGTCGQNGLPLPLTRRGHTATNGEPVGIGGDHLDLHAIEDKEHARQNHASLVGGDRKRDLLDHGLEHGTVHGDRRGGLDIRERGELLSR